MKNWVREVNNIANLLGIKNEELTTEYLYKLIKSNKVEYEEI